MTYLKSFSIILFFCALNISIQAQTFKWGLKGGISTPDVKPDDLNILKINNIKDSISLKLTDANYGWH